MITLILFFTVVVFLVTLFTAISTGNLQYKTFDTTLEPFINTTKSSPKIKILSKEETDHLIDSDADGYLKSLTTNDLAIRKSNSLQTYKQISKQQFCTSEINDTIVQKLHDACAQVHKKIAEHTRQQNRLFGIAIEAFLDIPWNFAIICTDNYENGFPHTRDDVIILPKTIIDSYSSTNPDKLCRLLIHEKTHVYQKKFPDTVQQYLLTNGFEKENRRYQDPANPDLNNFRYKHEKLGLMFSTYKTNSPTSFNDIQYAKEKDASSEHPYELIAYRMEQLFHKPAETISLVS